MQGLDPSIKAIIVGQLALADMARLSMTCREWHLYFLGYGRFRERVCYNQLMCRIQQTERCYKYRFMGKLILVNLVQHCLGILLSSTAAQTGANLERLISIFDVILEKVTTAWEVTTAWDKPDAIILTYDPSVRSRDYVMDELDVLVNQRAKHLIFFHGANVFVNPWRCSITSLLNDNDAYERFLKHWTGKQ